MKLAFEIAAFWIAGNIALGIRIWWTAIRPYHFGEPIPFGVWSKHPHVGAPVAKASPGPWRRAQLIAVRLP